MSEPQAEEAIEHQPLKYRMDSLVNALTSVSQREARILREAAGMGWVRGVRAAGGGRDDAWNAFQILTDVVASCRSNPDLYPTVAAAADGERHEPDWADVREAARNAGWSVRRDPDQRQARIWGLYGDGRLFIDWEHGWARSWRNRHSHVIDIAGPDAMGGHETVRLVNPTPAKVLAAAALVGLVGNGDAA